MPDAPLLFPSEIAYDVYGAPRLGPVEFGDFIAGEANEREAIVRAARFQRRVPHARAWFARQRIVDYLVRAVRDVGELEEARELARRGKDNPDWTEPERADAEASYETLSAFIRNLNALPLAGREIVALVEQQEPLAIGPLEIELDLACLLRSHSPKGGVDRIGGLYLNVRKGKGLGAREETKAKRRRAGEAVALLVFRLLMDRYADLGEPWQADALHYYVRAGQIWSAPEAYVNRLRNLEADARILASLWETVSPPTDFDPNFAIWKP